MKALRTFSINGKLFRQGDEIPAGMFPARQEKMLAIEGWLEPDIEVPTKPEIEKPAKKAKEKKK